ncbi:MAG: YdeI/OmpD-associated family protein [Actinomycetales bacterium]|jgi:hypothetical protein
MKFTGVLSEASGPGGRWVECPFDATKEFGEARPTVVGTVNGAAYRTRLMRYAGKTVMGLTKQIRETVGADVGDELVIEIEKDTAPRDVDVPEELAMALASDAPAQKVFDSLAFTHRKEYAQWIAEAKRPETRERRVAKALEMLTTGVKHP